MERSKYQQGEWTILTITNVMHPPEENDLSD